MRISERKAAVLWRIWAEVAVADMVDDSVGEERWWWLFLLVGKFLRVKMGKRVIISIVLCGGAKCACGTAFNIQVKICAALHIILVPRQPLINFQMKHYD